MSDKRRASEGAGVSRREEIAKLRAAVLIKVAGVGRNPTRPYYSTPQMDKLADHIVKLETRLANVISYCVDRTDGDHQPHDTHLAVVIGLARGEPNATQAYGAAPAQMSYAGRLVPINSTGMREVIDEASRLRKALYLISIVEQGCGGNLTFKEMAESAMRQARAALRGEEG